MKKARCPILILAAVGLPGMVLAAGGGSAGTGDVSVAGVFGIRPATEASGMAALIQIPKDMALGGIRWFNNDGTVTFPGIYVAPADDAGPPPLSTAILGASSVQGESSAWSAADFEQPVSAASGSVYVLLRIPAGSVQEAGGSGGGAGVGYTSDGTGSRGWITADGEDWCALGPGSRLAIVGTFVPAGAGVLVMNGEKRMGSVPEGDRCETVLSPPAPNPFNPQTVVAFSLARSGAVELTIHDLRGRLVRTLLHGHFEAGLHSTVWRGEDDRGRRLPSGVYFARLRTDGGIQTQRVALVK